MKKVLQIALGLITALGGFVDIGDLVFATQAGARFGYQLLWALALGIVMIMVYAEMSGRVAAIGKQGVFSLIKDRYPRWLGVVTLVGSKFVNVMTCAAEIGGVALVLQLLTGLPYRGLIIIAALTLILIVWWLPFGAIERLFGYGGLGLLVLAFAALRTHPVWSHVGAGFLPHGAGDHPLLYAYFAVGLIAATLMPYEAYFYSAGGIEEEWSEKDLSTNRLNSYLGFILGGGLVAAIIIGSADLFGSASINPQLINTAGLLALVTLGKVALILALLGMLFTISGSAIETGFSGAYNLSQYLRWQWGKHRPPKEVPKFTLSWLVIFAAAAMVILTGVDPITLTEYAVIFSVLVMPLTYLPILLVAGDEAVMGKHKNNRLTNSLGWLFFAVIVAVSLAAVPLMVLTSRGSS